MNYLVCLRVSVYIKYINKRTGKKKKRFHGYVLLCKSVNSGSDAGAERTTARERRTDSFMGWKGERK